MPKPFHMSKMMPPGPNPNQIKRGRLTQRILDAGWARTVLIQAPAGAGKTTLMQQTYSLLESRGTSVGWLTLDSSDDDVGRLIDGLRTVCERLANRSKRIDGGGPLATGDGESAPADLLERYGHIAYPFVLFVDEGESLQNPAALDLLRELADRIPVHGLLVFGTRALAGMELARLRACGEMVEIDGTDLRFSEAEVREFLSSRGLTLTDAHVGTLHRKTEGWAAALWLSSMVLERRRKPGEFIEHFSGLDVSLTDYLSEDVLSRLPESTRRFLMHTSILDHFNAELCDAVSGRQDSRRLLRELELRNLFLAQLDSEHGSQWYRYHSLFRQCLRGQLEARHAEEVPQLHRRASEWYQAHGRPVPAVDHALAGGQYQRAIELIAAQAEHLLGEGRVRLLNRWLDRLPAELLEKQPRLQVSYVWSLMFTGRLEEASEALSKVEDRLDNEVAAHRLALRPMLFTMMDRADKALAVGRANLAQLPPGNTYAHRVLRICVAHSVLLVGNFDEAHRLLGEAKALQGERMHSFNLIYSECTEGILELIQGHLQAALGHFDVAAHIGRTRSSPDETNANPMAGVLLAAAQYEDGRFDRARRLLHFHLPLVRAFGYPDQLISSYVILSRIASHEGDEQRAHRLLSELEYQGCRANLPRVAGSAHLERARLASLNGDLPAAERALQRADETFDWSKAAQLVANEVETLRVGRLRLLTRAKPAEAVEHLERELAETVATGRHHRALLLRILLAEAYQGAGDARRALQTMTEALRIGAREHLLSVFIDESSSTVVALMREVYARQMSTLNDEDTARLVAFVRALLDRFEPEPQSDARSEETTPAPVEALTGKELEVLTLLSRGLSNAQMANTLFVAETTIRTHLRNINMKLNSRNRTHAVAIARELKLVN